MKTEILEVAGIIPALQALRLPYSREPRSSKTPFAEKLHEYDDEYIAETNKHEYISKADIDLAGKLVKGGDCEAKAIRGIIAYLRVTAPRYWWTEFCTYRHGCECLSSESTVHTITKGVTRDMFDCEEDEAKEYVDILQPLIIDYNRTCVLIKSTTEAGATDAAKSLTAKRESQFRCIKRHVPECFMQTRIYAISYQCLRNMWIWRRNHRLKEWHIFLDAVKQLPFAEQLILVEK